MNRKSNERRGGRHHHHHRSQFGRKRMPTLERTLHEQGSTQDQTDTATQRPDRRGGRLSAAQLVEALKSKQAVPSWRSLWSLLVRVASEETLEGLYRSAVEECGLAEAVLGPEAFDDDGNITAAGLLNLDRALVPGVTGDHLLDLEEAFDDRAEVPIQSCARPTAHSPQDRMGEPVLFSAAIPSG